MKSGVPRIGATLVSRFLPSSNDGSIIRSILLLGFAAIFALWLASGYDLVRRVAEVERQAAAITTRFIEGEDLLFKVKAQVLLSSVYARDAVLDTGPEADSSRRQLKIARSEVEGSLQRYLPAVDSEVERTHWKRLQDELQEYWKSLYPVLTGQVFGSAIDAQAFLRREVIPKREMVVRISESIRTLNRADLRQQQEEASELHHVLRRRIWWTSGIAILLGGGVAVLAASYAGHLEARIRHQHLHEHQQKRELQRLSAELVRAQEEERRAIARDLHDEIGQALVAIKLDLGMIERSGNVSSGTAEALAEARSTTDAAIKTVRDLSQFLHPAMLDDFGLAVTLRAYVRSFSRRTGIRTELTLDRIDGRIASELELCVYRMVQEALTNVAKHAKASSSHVSLRRLSHTLVVSVEDDGKGIDPEPVRDLGGLSGLGLLSVRERASRLGGTVGLESHPGRGTRLTVELPLELAEPTVGETVDNASAVAG